jgi:ABC-2 type transport system ATP-binding protein
VGDGRAARRSAGPIVRAVTVRPQEAEVSAVRRSHDQDRAGDGPGGPEPAIRIRGLVKEYKGQRALHGVDLDVRHGEVFALLGPNGAGKTTMVEIMEGFRDRDGGTVHVLGVDPQRADDAWKARVGVVLQSTSEFEDLNVGEVLRHFARFYPNPYNVDELLELLGIAEAKKKRIAKLSGGQQRRMDVALGMIGRPELLFLDEPTTGFDPRSRRDFWDFIQHLAERGTTILLTTHYLEEAEFLADRAAVLVKGRIIDVATPATLGGRDLEAAVVGWVDAEGREQTVHTTTPGKIVAGLVDRFGGEVPGLTVTRPSLNDVYLEMIEAAEHPDAPAVDQTATRAGSLASAAAAAADQAAGKVAGPAGDQAAPPAGPADQSTDAGAAAAAGTDVFVESGS